MIELNSRYEPKEVEDRIYKYWQEHNLFSAKANPDKPEGNACLPARQGLASHKPEGDGAASDSRSHSQSQNPFFLSPG